MSNNRGDYLNKIWYRYIIETLSAALKDDVVEKKLGHKKLFIIYISTKVVYKIWKP